MLGYFKTLKTKSAIDPDEICEEMFSSFKIIHQEILCKFYVTLGLSYLIFKQPDPGTHDFPLKLCTP